MRSRLLSSSFAGRQLAANVKRVEGELVQRSDDVWVCSWDDADAMAKTYGVPRERFHLVPNCADTHLLRPASEIERERPKRSRMDRTVTSPSSSAAATARIPKRRHSSSMQLAPAFPDMVFAIAGSVKEDYLRTHPSALPANVELLGVLSETELYSIFAAAEYGLNPVEVGSGTNLKLVQYMAAGLAIVSTGDRCQGHRARGGDLRCRRARSVREGAGDAAGRSCQGATARPAGADGGRASLRLVGGCAWSGGANQLSVALPAAHESALLLGGHSHL